jgi:hypothetical protein
VLNPSGKRVYTVKKLATPLSKKSKKPPAPPRGTFFATIHHVKPAGGEKAACGYGVTIEAYGEKLMVHHVYNRAEPASRLYMDTIDCIPRVNNLVLNGVRQTNQAGYPVKILVFQCDHDVTRAQLEEWFNDVFVPALMIASPLTVDAPPTLHPTDGYKIVPTWYSILDNADLTWVLQHMYGPLGPYFRSSQIHLYSAWGIGQVPVNLMFQYGLNATHLASGDQVRLASENIRRGVQAAYDLGVHRTADTSAVTNNILGNIVEPRVTDAIVAGDTDEGFVSAADDAADAEN